MNEQNYPSWLAQVDDPAKRAAYLRQLQLEQTNRILEEQRGHSGRDFLPPATPPRDEYESYLRSLMSGAERLRVERGWHGGEGGR
jgi:hypothetical protein